MPNNDCIEREFDSPESIMAIRSTALRVVVPGDDWDKLEEPEWVIWPLDEELDEAAF